MTTLEFINNLKLARNGDPDAVREIIITMKPILTETPKIMQLRSGTDEITPQDINNYINFVLIELLRDEKDRNRFCNELIKLLNPEKSWEKGEQNKVFDYCEKIFCFWKGFTGDKRYFGSLTCYYQDYVLGWIKKKNPSYTQDDLDEIFDQLIANMSRWCNCQSFFAFPTFLITSTKRIIYSKLQKEPLLPEKPPGFVQPVQPIRMIAALCRRRAQPTCYDVILYTYAELFTTDPSLFQRILQLIPLEKKTEMFYKTFAVKNEVEYYRLRRACLDLFEKCMKDENVEKFLG